MTERNLLDDLRAALLDGQAALERDDHARAVTAFTRAQALAPADPHVALALANACRLAGDPVRARETLQAASRTLCAPGQATADAGLAHALGAALLETGAPADAAACFEQVVALRPADPAGVAALAAARRASGDAVRAWPLIQRALSLGTPGSASPHPASLVTAAQIRHGLGDPRGALFWFDKADAARPGHAPTRLQRAYSTLITGVSAEGWAHFESRPLPAPATRARAWQGEPLEGGSVLVTAEQGIGDQFQFLRFVSLLPERGAGRIVVECHADVVRLFAANGFEAVARDSRVETDWHVPLMSLPHRLGTGERTLREVVPYLQAGPNSSAIGWPARIPGTRRLGLVWAGNPAFPGRTTRDFDTHLLPALVAIPGIAWMSLQHGGSGDHPPTGVARGPRPADWAETAAVLASLDGLVTTDTGIAHLAGAMGVSTWTMLQHVPDWRWGLRDEHTPWYPSMRLVRQRRAGDWVGVVERLRAMLTEATPTRTE